MFMNTKAFTLIELLVVILIIGILAAMALPQYQKAVEKSRAAQALVALKSVYQSNLAYYLENGQRPTKIAELDIALPWNGSYNYISGTDAVGAISNEDWSLSIYHASNDLDGICIVRIQGPYAGGGFCMFHHIPVSGAEAVLSADELYCIEREAGSVITLQKNSGDYCKKLFGATQKSAGNLTTFTLP